MDYEYNGITVKAGKGVNTKLILMYLKNTDGKGTSGFYVYDSVAKTFSLYIEASEPILLMRCFRLRIPWKNRMDIKDDLYDWRTDGRCINV